jgi:hypothetical protein
MLNAFDLLGIVLERVTSFAMAHWLFLVIVVLAIGLRSAAPWRRLQDSGRRQAAALQRPPSDGFALLIVVITSLTLSICAALLHGMPLPRYHDDFAYLLDGDTFAHGRMSNPTHPLWPHFETMHVLHVPRYISKYPIGQGLIFAAGSVLLGHPLRAVWIIGAAACAAIWWALRVWTTPSLALLGGFATAVHPTFLEWTESYHGGAMAALGGALMFAGAGRLREKSSWSMSALVGAGVVLLMISRPYEGLIFTIAIGVLLLRRSFLRVAPAGLLIVLAGLAFVAFNNWSITGNPVVLPYSVYERQYDPAPNFIWEKARPMPHYRNAEMAFVYRVTYLGQYKRVHAPGGLVDETLKKLDVIERAVFGSAAAPIFANAWPLFLVLILVWGAAALGGAAVTLRLLTLVLLLFAFAPFSIIWWLQLHYLAPAAAVAACLVMLLVRRCFALSPILGAAVVVLFFANAAVTWYSWIRTPDGGFEPHRQQIAQTLEARGGRHLVIVAPDVFDAVYNGADLNGAPIVWARDFGVDANATLWAYYRDREIWLLERSGIRRY